MEDLIDRDAAIRMLSDYAETQQDLDYYRDMLMGIPAVNRWIPVEDALPEDDENVLVYILTSHMNFIELAHIHKGVFRSAWNHDKITNVEITHWMPMPEPPEKE